MGLFERRGQSPAARMLEEADRALSRGEEDRGATLLRDAADLLVDDGDFELAMNECIQRRAYGKAAEIAERKKDRKRAAQLYFRGGDFLNAARLNLRVGEESLAAELFERAGAYAQAGAIYEKQGDLVRAARLFERVPDPKRAADLAVRALSGESIERLRGSEAAEVCRWAGSLYAQIGMADLSVKVLRWGHQHRPAAQVLVASGRIEEAMALLADRGDLLGAAEIASECGQRTREHRYLAERAEREGRFLEAAQHYERAGAFLEAAPQYEYAGAHKDAARVYAEAGQFDVAAEYFQRLGMLAEAQGCLRSSGRIEEADALERRERGDDSVRHYLAVGDFLKAAVVILAKARGGDEDSYREAAEYLDRIDEAHPDYIPARAMLADALLEQGHEDRALNVLEVLFQGVTPNHKHLPALYQYGHLLEIQGFLARARATYRAAYWLQPDFRDIRERLDRLKERPELPANERPTNDLQRAAGLPSLFKGPPMRSNSMLMPIPIPPSESKEVPAVLAASGMVPAPETSDIQAPTPPSGTVLGVSNWAQAMTVDPAESPTIHRSESSARFERALDTSESNKKDPARLGGVVLRGRFRIERRIGRGAQAYVYLARDQVLDRPVAIKVLLDPSSSEEGMERFLREARLAARVRHSGCIAVYDFGEEHGLTFMAMEYFQGRTIHDLIVGGKLDTNLALRIARDVASALGAVHESGIVHRDVKPTNIMVDTAGRVRLTDFGVATNADDASVRGIMVGTMRYMAPEQARGKDSDRRVDVFSLGVVIWEMLAGRPPYGPSLDDLIARVKEPPPPVPADSGVSDWVRGIVGRCMASAAVSRYESMGSLIDDLNIALTELKARSPSRPG